VENRLPLWHQAELRAEPQREAVASKLGVHRRMVRQAMASAVPAERKDQIGNSPNWDR
jgi:hypothetical protein